MIAILIRSMILYIAVLVGLRVMGKSEMAEMNSFELVITLLIAEVAAIPMADNRIPISYGISAIIGLVFIQVLTSFLSLKSKKFRNLVTGTPSILVSKGKIDIKALKKEGISIEELLDQLRIQGYFNIKDVQYVILETDGQLSVVPSPYQPQNQNNLFKHLPISIILDGKLIKDSLLTINKNEHWLNHKLSQKGIHSYKDVLVCILDENDKLIIQKKDTMV